MLQKQFLLAAANKGIGIKPPANNSNPTGSVFQTGFNIHKNQSQVPSLDLSKIPPTLENEPPQV